MIKSRFIVAIAMAATLSIGGFAFADVTSDSSSPAVGIPDNADDGTLAGFVTDTISVTGHTSSAGLTLSDISVDVAISHTWIGDLTVLLETPDGDFLGLVSRPGQAEIGDGSDCCGTNGVWAGTAETWSVAGTVDAETMTTATLGVGTAWAASPETTAANYGSVSSMSDLLGGTPNGTWTLHVADSVAADAGTLDSWTLNLTSVAAVPEPAAAIFIGLGALGLCVRRKR